MWIIQTVQKIQMVSCHAVKLSCCAHREHIAVGVNDCVGFWFHPKSSFLLGPLSCVAVTSWRPQPTMTCPWRAPPWPSPRRISAPPPRPTTDPLRRRSAAAPSCLKEERRRRKRPRGENRRFAPAPLVQRILHFFTLWLTFCLSFVKVHSAGEPGSSHHPALVQTPCQEETR